MKQEWPFLILTIGAQNPNGQSALISLGEERNCFVLKKDWDQGQFHQMGHIITNSNRKQLCVLME
jgi:hypothetical protein